MRRSLLQRASEGGACHRFLSSTLVPHTGIRFCKDLLDGI
jgi:hypothetical protein